MSETTSSVSTCPSKKVSRAFDTYTTILNWREHTGRWLRDGCVRVLDKGIKDYCAPTRIYKVQMLGVTKMVTRPNSDEATEMGGNDELAY